MKLQSYPWHVEHWLASETRAAFGLAERGLYRELVDLCWHHGSLPAAQDTLCAMLGTAAPRQMLETVLREFTLAADGRYHHTRIDQERAKLLEVRKQRRTGGNAGASSGHLGAEFGARGGRPRKTPLEGGSMAASASVSQQFTEIGLNVSSEIDEFLPAQFIENEYGKRIANPEYQRVQQVLRGAKERIERANNPEAYARTVLLREGLLRRPPAGGPRSGK